MSDVKNDPGLTGVILAAGKGVRAYPSTKYIPKGLIKVDGTTLIERNIEIMRDQLQIRTIILVIGYLGDQIVKYFDDRENAMGVKLKYIYQNAQKGIGDALLQVEQHINSERFLVILGDELYIDFDHSKLLDIADKDFAAVLTFKEEKDHRKIEKNFIAYFENDRVLSLKEKPKNPDTNLMGLGTYLLTNKVFHYLKSTNISSLRGEVEITDALSDMAKHEKVLACTLSGEYVNITTRDDVNYANYFIRNTKSTEYKVSVVIPAYNEEETIASVIRDFKNHPRVDEILVVNNNSRDRTHEISQEEGARVILEERQGYGCALKRGLDEAQGDIIVLTEADGSFKAKDISKLLEYLKDCDMAIGTRTTRQMIEQGANMDYITRLANVLFGKFIEILWWKQEPRFTDVGCTYRAVWKHSYQDIRDIVNNPGPGFSAEMMIAMLISRKRVIEIPVSYYRRTGGESAYSRNYRARAKTALKMFVVTLNYRLRLKP